MTHHHAARVARNALRRFRGNARPILEDRLTRRVGIGQDRGVFNVGTGRETSVAELYELCARVAGSDAPAEHAPARLGELQRSFLDPELAARELGFTAMVDLEDGLRATWDWIRQA